MVGVRVNALGAGVSGSPHEINRHLRLKCFLVNFSMNLCLDCFLSYTAHTVKSEQNELNMSQ